MRTEAYRKAGGYRWQFYYGQDWDLWYRLAELGMFAMVPATLYRARVLPEGISAVHRDRQVAIDRCHQEVRRLRSRHAEDAPALARAAEIRPGGSAGVVQRTRPSEGWYAVGEQLRRNGDPRCIRYLREAICRSPSDPRPWVRLVQALLLMSCSVRRGSGA